MNDRDRWDVLGYVLEDPELDRAAFESRMLDDVDLALEVASAVQQVELIRKVAGASGLGANASNIIRPAAVHTAVHEAHVGWHWSSLCGLAVALLLAIGFGQAQLRRLAKPTEQSVLASASTAQVLADHWLALRMDVRSDGTIAGDGSDGSGEDLRESLGPDENELDDHEDWLLEAAREFYAQGVAS